MNGTNGILEDRQRAVEARLDPRWHPQTASPVIGSGLVVFEVSKRIEAMCFGGLGLILSLVRRLGLAAEIDKRVELFKRHVPYHESDHVLALVYVILTGGRCLEGLSSRRSSLPFLKLLGARRLPSPTASGDFLRRFSRTSVVALMSAINEVRARVWRLQPRSERRLATIDVDGTMVPTWAKCKEDMSMSYDGRWGFMPLVVSLANTQEPLYVVNRPGNRPSHDGAVEWMDRAVEWSVFEAEFEQVRLRGDTDFSLTGNFDRWTSNNVEFVFGMDASPGLVKRAKNTDERLWAPLDRPGKVLRATRRRRSEDVKSKVVEEKCLRDLTLEEEHIAEIAYKPGKCRREYRLIILRKHIKVVKGQLRIEDEIRYFFYITNVKAEILNTAGVVRESNARCNQENLIEQLKNGVEATRLPVREFDANWTYLVIGSLAWSIKQWAGLLLPQKLGGRSILGMEFRRFLDQLILIPAQIIETGRQLIVRLLDINRHTKLLIEGSACLRACKWKFG